MATNCRKSQGSDVVQRSFGRLSDAKACAGSDKPRAARLEAAIRPLANLLAIAVGLAIAGFCAVVIYRNAQLSNGDGTGMQWVVLVPLAMLFFVVAVTASILGITGLRSSLSPDHTEALGRDRKRAFELLFKFLAIVIAFFSLVPAVIGFFLGLFE